MKSPRISIVIPSLNSYRLGDILENLSNQNLAKAVCEIIVVGKDEPGEIDSMRFPSVKFIDTGKVVNASRARNIGINHASGDILLFLDSDCLPGRDWLKFHLDSHAKGAQIVGGGVEPVGENFWSLVYNLTLFHEYLSTLGPGDKRYFPTLNLSVHRTVIEAVGLLDETLVRGQDIEWTRRMSDSGFPIHFSPRAAVVHLHNRTTLGAVWRDCARSGYYMRQSRVKYSQTSTISPFIYNKALLLLGSPMIALLVTCRIVFTNPKLFAQYWYTIPGIYLTKIAWCWGASRPHFL